jgi:hypothetical protein
VWLLLQATPAPPLGGFPIPFDQLLGPYGVVVLLAIMWWMERRERIETQARNEELEKEARAVGQKALEAVMARDSQRP